MAITDIRVVQYYKDEWVDTEEGARLIKVFENYVMEVKHDGGEWTQNPITHVEKHD